VACWTPPTHCRPFPRAAVAGGARCVCAWTFPPPKLRQWLAIFRSHCRYFFILRMVFDASGCQPRRPENVSTRCQADRRQNPRYNVSDRLHVSPRS
jgi:hypothetical protein